jgi:CRP/FNR family transcriptional regulator, cyclic AMP receptor protein
MIKPTTHNVCTPHDERRVLTRTHQSDAMAAHYGCRLVSLVPASTTSRASVEVVTPAHRLDRFLDGEFDVGWVDRSPDDDVHDRVVYHGTTVVQHGCGYAGGGAVWVAGLAGTQWGRPRPSVNGEPRCRVAHVRRVMRGTACHALSGAGWKRPHPTRPTTGGRDPRKGETMRIRSPQHRRLALLDLFARCTAKEINTIDALGTEVAVRAGTAVWREDLTAPQFIVVLEGLIELTRARDHVATLTPGGWFGHVALLARLPAESVSGVASTPTRLLAFSRREFASLLRDVPTVATPLQQPTAGTALSKHGRQKLAPVETRPATPRLPAIARTPADHDRAKGTLESTRRARG